MVLQGRKTTINNLYLVNNTAVGGM